MAQIFSQPNFVAMADNLHAVSEQFRLCNNMAAVQQAEQMNALLHEMQAVRTEMRQMRQEMRDGFQTQKALHHNHTARLQNSQLVRKARDSLAVLHSLQTNEPIAHFPNTFAEIDTIASVTASEILHALGVEVPQGVQQRRAAVKRALGPSQYEATELSPRKGGGRVVILDTAKKSFDNILAEWDAEDEKHARSLAIADREVAKTDHTLWFKRNEWPEHLAGSNLRQLSLASRLPSKEERVLQQAVEINKTLIESCVEGLRTLDREVRRWLRSAKLSEPDVRPLARLQNLESQRTSVAYISRLLCYSLRVLQSQQAQEIRHEDSVSSASADGSDDDSSSDDGTVGRQHSIDLTRGSTPTSTKTPGGCI
ncbi:hypothetical protein KC316_g4010 [Hortaea werneckii]|nr:hypothetical protein KC324_g4088 [Hortaea werneckii]KAI7589332.1 hypothetical protein KC316_g4010 [Hortaea werneckii]